MKKPIVFLLLLLQGISAFAQEKGIDERIEEWFAPISEKVTSIVFFSVKILNINVPVVLIVLILGALWFTLYNNFANFRLIGVAIRAARGKYDDVDVHAVDVVYGDPTPGGDVFEDPRREDVVGEVTHFQALTAALSATVGLGNIAGVAVAIALGGPGATVWMILAGFLGMSTKMVEATLGVKYREVDEDGKVYGGPMYYLSKGFMKINKNAGYFGKFLAAFFAVMVIGGSFGGGNMFQANQAASQFKLLFGLQDSGAAGFIFGVLIAFLVGLVIIGGIQRIGRITEKIVPFMGILYVGAALVIILLNYDVIPAAMKQIWEGAFNMKAGIGGLVGVMIVGFRRAAFSNEAGVGSASIAHSAVRTRFPASEGIVASIGPFVDTVIICTMTALVVIITNLKNNLFDYANTDGSLVTLNTGEKLGGVDLTSVAFDSAIPNFSIVLTIAVILFAFSTMLSWSYYGIQGWKYLFGRGKKSDLTYKVLFLIFVVIGSSSALNSVIDFSDSMIFAMVFPNVIGLLVLAPEVKKEIKRYLDAIGYYKDKK